MPFFSVIIPSYNRYESLRRAIGSVLAQTFCDFELVVVDDGSTDSTPQIADEFRGRLTYLRQDNAGVSAARNLGVARSSSPYIAFLDSDDLWLPGKLALHRDYIGHNPRVRLHQTDELWIRNGRRVNPMNRHRKPEGRVFIPSLELCLISPSCAVLHRGLFDDAGMFDEKMPVCEDYDLWLRLTWREEAGLIHERCTIKYGGHADQLSHRFCGMDRFRLYSIIKVLRLYGGAMRDEDKTAAVIAAKKKCRILAGGAQKRGNAAFTEYLHAIGAALEKDTCNSIDFESLVAG